MAHIFRLHSQGNNTITDWQTIPTGYNSGVIDQIEDPNGGRTQFEIKSIPSPFARIELMKTAFKEVNNSKDDFGNVDLNGTTVYHKMVSDCLDVAEIFFNADSLKNEIEIIVWDKNTEIAELKHSNDAWHKLIGETLDVFLQQDADAYNFGAMQTLYLLNYKGKNAPNLINIIGATSPSTLFISAANDLLDGNKNALDYVSKNINFGSDRPFDNAFNPLYKRDFEFVEFLFAYRLSIPNFSNFFPEVNEYLDLSYMQLEDAKKQQINTLTSNCCGSKWKSINCANGNAVEILGHNICAKNPIGVINSDFEIASSNNENKILILPIDGGNIYQNWNYIQGYPFNGAPASDSNPVGSRTLPNTVITYPYLTTSDFLENTIICLGDRPISSKSFFNGNLPNSSNTGYLLPLTNLFFEYFPNSDIAKMLTINPLSGGGVEVELRIPVKKQGSEVVLKRTYYSNREANIDKNEGCVRSLSDFDISLFPNLKFADRAFASYRIASLCNIEEKDNYNVECYVGGTKINLETPLIRNTNSNKYKANKIFALDGGTFDYIRINTKDASGVIIPNFSKPNGKNQFSFAVDLGTTNTHIEYKVGNGPSKLLDIKKNDAQIHLLTERVGDDIRFLLDYDMLPECLGVDGAESTFPTRTALAYDGTLTFNEPIVPLSNVNTCFPFEYRAKYAYDKVATNIKWANDGNSPQKIQAYIENILILIKNKVLLNQGDLSKTKVIWFYPMSMPTARINQLKNAWNTAFTKHINSNLGNIGSMVESISTVIILSTFPCFCL